VAAFELKDDYGWRGENVPELPENIHNWNGGETDPGLTDFNHPERMWTLR